MAGTRKYADLVSKAEAAVAGIKDPALKGIAFQKILDSLLATGSGKSGRVQSASVKGQQQGRRPSGPQGHLEALAEEGFFKTQKTIAQVKTELDNLGHHIPITSLSGPLQNLVKKRVLRRQRVKVSGKKQSYAYSNW